MRYESAIQQLLLDPLGLAHTGFFTDELIGDNITASHIVENGQPVIDLDEQPPEIEQEAAQAVADSPAVVDTAAWTFPRSLTHGRPHLHHPRHAYLRPLPLG